MLIVDRVQDEGRLWVTEDLPPISGGWASLDLSSQAISLDSAKWLTALREHLMDPKELTWTPESNSPIFEEPGLRDMVFSGDIKPPVLNPLGLGSSGSTTHESPMNDTVTTQAIEGMDRWTLDRVAIAPGREILVIVGYPDWESERANWMVVDAATAVVLAFRKG
jgi:hypothetical protein